MGHCPPSNAAVDPSLYSQCVSVCVYTVCKRERERERESEGEKERKRESGASRCGPGRPIQPPDVFTSLLTTEEEH